MNKDYEEQLEVIRKARIGIRANDILFVLCVFAALLLSLAKIFSLDIFPVLIPIVGLLILGVIQMREQVRDVARMPCPRCQEPFGWSGSTYLLTLSDLACQNCGLDLYFKKERK